VRKDTDCASSIIRVCSPTVLTCFNAVSIGCKELCVVDNVDIAYAASASLPVNTISFYFHYGLFFI